MNDDDSECCASGRCEVCSPSFAAEIRAFDGPSVPRTVAEINAEYWQKELDKLQPTLRYSMHVQRELSKARAALDGEQ